MHSELSSAEPGRPLAAALKGTKVISSGVNSKLQAPKSKQIRMTENPMAKPKIAIA
jgi:hypothetical protein